MDCVHGGDYVINERIEEHEESEKSFNVTDDFDIEFTPKKTTPEKQDGVNIKGNYDEFKEAS